MKESFTALWDASAIHDNVFLTNKLISYEDDVIFNPPSLNVLFSAK